MLFQSWERNPSRILPETSPTTLTYLINWYCAQTTVPGGGSVAKLCPRPCRAMTLVGLASGRSTVIDFKGSHFEREIVLWGVRWYVTYPFSYCQLEKMMEERGVEVDHSSLNRWVLKYARLLDQAFRARKRRVGGRWRMDEIYVRIRGQWKYTSLTR